MKEFMLLIRTVGDHLTEMSPEQQKLHVQKIGNYIEKLMLEKKLKSAQPLEMEAKTIHGRNRNVKDGPFIESKEVIVGYFHIIAEDMQEAITIANENPILDDVESSIEIRQIKTMDGIN